MTDIYLHLETHPYYHSSVHGAGRQATTALQSTRRPHFVPLELARPSMAGITQLNSSATTKNTRRSQTIHSPCPCYSINASDTRAARLTGACTINRPLITMHDWNLPTYCCAHGRLYGHASVGSLWTSLEKGLGLSISIGWSCHQSVNQMMMHHLYPRVLSYIYINFISISTVCVKKLSDQPDLL